MNFAEYLKKYQVTIEPNPTGLLTVLESVNVTFDKVAAEIKNASGAPNNAVAASIFMRRYGMFVSALLFLKAHNKMWDGTLDSIFIDIEGNNLSFRIDSRLLRDAKENDLKHILYYHCKTVIDLLVTKTHISKYLLWENLWGYIQWMYSHTENEQSKKDLATLLDDQIWQPKIRASMFQKFLGNQSPEEASLKYQRMTCCLLKEIPGNKECPYCPHLKRR